MFVKNYNIYIWQDQLMAESKSLSTMSRAHFGSDFCSMSLTLDSQSQVCDNDRHTRDQEQLETLQIYHKPCFFHLETEQILETRVPF